MNNYLVVYVTTYGTFEGVVGGNSILDARNNFFTHCDDVCEVEDLLEIKSVKRIDNVLAS